MAKIKVWGWQCERCGHKWTPRVVVAASESDEADGPRVCPKCKNPYWNTARKADDDSPKTRKNS